MACPISMLPRSLLAVGINAEEVTAKHGDDSSLSSQGNKPYKLTHPVLCAHTILSSCWLISTKVDRGQKISGRIRS